jgi:DUF1365 family protein
MKSNKNSKSLSLYKGEIIHNRYEPKKHGFIYPWHSIWLALDDLQNAQILQPNWFAKSNSNSLLKNIRNKFRLVNFNRKNYLGDPSVSLADTVRNIAQLKNTKKNQVFFLGQLDWFGFYFSPVNFYFIGDGDNFHTLLAEVNNTPWNEKHSYIVPLNRENSSQKLYTHEKAFQVSPFMSSKQTYEWNIKYKDDSIQISIKSKETNLIFIATMNLTKTPIERFTMLKIFLLTPGLMFGSVIRIYFQALILFIKGVPFLGHLGDHGNQTKKI